MDKANVKIWGERRYLYRAVDKATRSFFLRAKCNKAAT
ncbi:hypothetical protein [Burkholderia sp. S171]